MVAGWMPSLPLAPRPNARWATDTAYTSKSFRVLAACGDAASALLIRRDMLTSKLLPVGFEPSSAPGRPELRASIERRLCDVSRASWDGSFGQTLGMRHDVLRATEESGINDLRTYYASFHDARGELVGRANLYNVDFDLATTDKKLSPRARAAIKAWFPRFMTFRFLECGLFTMIGNAVETRGPRHVGPVLRTLAAEMQRLAQTEHADFLMIRDVPADAYDVHRDVLVPLGFRPTLGFANVTIDITWPSLAAALGTLQSKTRVFFRKIQRFRELGIEHERVFDYAPLAPILARLWRNVRDSAPDYAREEITASFFERCADALAGKSLVHLFRHRGEPVAFFLVLLGDHEDVMLEWGIDRDFEHYRTANLYRAGMLIALEDAIHTGKKRLELGITNYAPKRSLPGARVQPLVYFVRHRDEVAHGATLARLMSFNIVQPPVEPDAAAAQDALEERIRRDQDERTETDLFRKVERQHKFDALRLGGIYGFYPEFQTAQGSSVRFDGQDDVVLVGTNSYLGLATHPEVTTAAKEAIDRYGTGCSGSPLLNGTLDLHRRLEEELAAFMGKPAAVLCSTGYQTNVAALCALCGAEDLIILDARDHRSLFDAARLSGADFVIYRHNDMGHLEQVLRRNAARRKLVVVDSVYSMEGTIADLASICRLAATYGARVYVDESHALGVLGPGGRGVAEAHGVLEQVDLVMGTFSKALAAVGGFVAGERKVIEHIKHNGAGHIFSASLPPPVVAAVLASLEIVKREPERRTAVIERATFMAAGLRRLGYSAEFHGAPIVPVVLGSFPFALAAYRQLMRDGLYVNPVGPPAVPEERSGFRTSYMATHRWEDLRRALEVFERYRTQLADPARQERST
jgi:8-amino-7-oxononanoate synthase